MPPTNLQRFGSFQLRRRPLRLVGYEAFAVTSVGIPCRIVARWWLVDEIRLGKDRLQRAGNRTIDSCEGKKSEVASSMNKRFRFLFFFSCLIGTHVSGDDSLWNLYESKLKQAKYVDLTHTITPSIPVWSGFGQSKFSPAINPETKQPYAFAKDGFEATRYELATDQLGTQLDPPGHWAPEYPAIDEIPATFAVRPLVDLYRRTTQERR